MEQTPVYKEIFYFGRKYGIHHSADNSMFFQFLKLLIQNPSGGFGMTMAAMVALVSKYGL
jgi:hypothetical protein